MPIRMIKPYQKPSTRQEKTPPFGTPLTITFTPPIPCSSIANPQFTVTASIPAPPSLGTLQQLLETPPTLASDTPASTFAESTGSANRRPLLLMSQQDVAARTIAPPTAEAQGAENKTPKTPKKEEVRRPGGKK